MHCDSHGDRGGDGRGNAARDARGGDGRHHGPRYGLLCLLTPTKGAGPLLEDFRFDF